MNHKLAANGCVPVTESVPFQQSKMFDLGEMEVHLDRNTDALWTFMAPRGSPNFSINMLHDILTIQDETRRLHPEWKDDLKYIILSSRFPGVFNLGGDLALFASLIENQDREKLGFYAKKCIEVFFNNYTSLDLPIITIALVQGDALGGGFEAALSFNVIVAERGVKFGLPETLFGLFPGMGAHAVLVRKLGAAKAEKMISSGRTYFAEELHDMGIVHILAEPGEGEAAVHNFIRRKSSHHHSLCGAYDALRAVAPLTYEELDRIVGIWVETALAIDKNNLKLMHRFASAQTKLVLNVQRERALMVSA